jgi:catechol 2,3-dioxygenase-like lactoylglutathione lyase family enzyme
MTTPAVTRAVPTLRVTNVDASLPFYAALGFTVAWQHQLSSSAPRLTAVQHGPVQVFLTEHAVAPVAGVVYFETISIDVLIERAVQAGFQPGFGPENRPWGSPEAYFTDPDGNVLRFGESLQ